MAKKISFVLIALCVGFVLGLFAGSYLTGILGQGNLLMVGSGIAGLGICESLRRYIRSGDKDKRAAGGSPDIATAVGLADRAIENLQSASGHSSDSAGYASSLADKLEQRK